MLCILCVTVTPSDQIINIFDENGLCLNISSVIAKHFWIQPNTEYCNAKVICCSCWNALDAFHKFYQKVEEAHFKLVNVPIEDDGSESDNFDSYPEFTVGSDVKLEIYEDYRLNLPESDVEEPMVPLDGIAGSVQQIKSEYDSDVSLDKLSRRRKSTKYEELAVSDSNSNASINKNSRQELTDDDSDYTSPKTKGKRESRKRVSCKEFDNYIKHNMELSCEICHMESTRFSILKEHYRSVHNEDAYVTCCDKKFDSRRALVHHILLHTNPETFKCEICDKTMSNKKSFSSHMKTHAYEDRNYQCKKCEKSFSRKEKFDRHMETHVQLEEICEQFGKVCR